MPKEALKRFEKHLLYSKEKIFYQAIYIEDWAIQQFKLTEQMQT